jgi:hypothetical protein
MKNVLDMLLEEMKRSDDFKSEHYGAIGGEDYPDIADQVLNNHRGATLLMMAFMKSTSGIPKMACYMQEHGMDGETLESGEVVAKFMRDNFDTFRPWLDMLYWGIKIGRKLEREDGKIDETLKRMEETLAEAPAAAATSDRGQCPVCHKPIEDGDELEMAGGPHCICTDPKLKDHRKLFRVAPNGETERGFVGNDGKEHWL